MQLLKTEKLLSIYESILQLCKVFGISFNEIISCFYCGSNGKYSNYFGYNNHLLIIIKDNPKYIFHLSILTKNGYYTAGFVSSSYTNHDQYRIITETVYKTYGQEIFNNDWVDDNDPYKQGLSILDNMKRFNKLGSLI